MLRHVCWSVAIKASQVNSDHMTFDGPDIMRKHLPIFPWLLTLVLISVCPAAPAAAAKPAPPTQPTRGPGGSDYAHDELVGSVVGKGATACYIFEPAKPRPAKAPLIVFNHGYLAVDPVAYGRWIEHMVRRGNIVVYPVYQEGLTLSIALTPNAITGVKAAIAELQKGDHVKPDLDRFAIVGHSAGGIISANMAATWKKEGLPQPRAVMCVQPGISKLFPVADLKQIPKETLLISLFSDNDKITGDADARMIFAQATQVSPGNKALIELTSDKHGWPDMNADHFAPAAVGGKGIDPRGMTRLRMRAMFDSLKDRNGENSGGVSRNTKDADDKDDKEDKTPAGGNKRTEELVALFTNGLDYYGTWKLFDGLTDAAFHGRNREYALGNTRQQRFMGKWSDGVPVKELKVVEPKDGR